MKGIVVVPPEVRDQKSTPTADEPVVGRWYWVAGEDKEEGKYRWLASVVHVGSNYVELKGPSRSGGSTQSVRIHFDKFWQHCEHVPDPDPIIDGQIAEHKERARALMEEVRAVTARLGVGERIGLPVAGDEDVKALSVRTGEPAAKYKKALIKANTKTLPGLFEKIKEANKSLGKWMKVKLIPLEAESEALFGVVDHVNDRIFSVELYAGLVEEVVCVREGEPAPNDTPVHLLQRRAYMDEECLANYEIGGMDYKKIADFDRWLAKPANFTRVLPFPRTLLAFQVRRNEKDREVTLGNLIEVMNERQYDKWTFLYIRNGERLYRMGTEVEFEEQLFPDTNHKLFTAQKLWCKRFVHDIKDIISDDEYQGRIEDERKQDLELEKVPEKERWHHRRFHDTADEYFAFTPENVYYDDIAALLAKEKKKHNRLVLILQGLLDRSPVLHPHPPWQLWTNEGFASAFRLIYDDSKALSAGDKPDFEAYRAKLNAHLVAGSLTIGQERVWLRREAERENKRREAHHSWGEGGSRELATYRPSGDPGPGKIARVTEHDAKEGTCTYAWKRSKRSRNGWGIEGTEVPARLVTGEERVLNIDAYRPGDYHIFFDDPRTRQEYLEWAPLLLEAEECHAGNRGEKPNRALPPARKIVVREEERPEDMEPAKDAKPRRSPAEKWEGKKVKLKWDMKTRGGTTFAKGEILDVSSYSRKRLTLCEPKENGRRCISGVELHSVILVEDE